MSQPKRRKTDHCILHVTGLKHDEFVRLCNTKGSPIDKLAQLKDIRDKRLAQPTDSPYRMEEACRNIPENLDEVDLSETGYHRICYQTFTKNVDRLKPMTLKETPDETSSRSPRKLPSASNLFPPECIFCEKLETKVSRKTETCTTFSVFKDKDGTMREPSWKQVEVKALALGDNRLFRMVQGEDLFAREAHFHPSCRNKFNLKYLKLIESKSTLEADDDYVEQKSTLEAHQKAFSHVLDYIQQTVIQENDVVQLSSLVELYNQELTNSGMQNPDYKSYKLKPRLQNHAINEKIGFAKVPFKGCIFQNLIYNADLSVSNAVARAYLLASRDTYADAANKLRTEIQQAFQNSKANPTPWPPTPTDLEEISLEGLLPSDVIRFMSLLMTGDGNFEKTEKNKRIVLSICQVSLFLYTCILIYAEYWYSMCNIKILFSGHLSCSHHK